MLSEVEQDDLYDCIEWIAQQPWCAGKVGMLGESLLAWSQWFAAAKQPPHLACILPWDAGADLYRDVAWHGGMMAVQAAAPSFTTLASLKNFLGGSSRKSSFSI